MEINLDQPLIQLGSGLTIQQIADLTDKITELKAIIEDEHTLPRQMTHWEYEFIQNVSIQFEELKNISSEQLKKIEELHDKYC